MINNILAKIEANLAGVDDAVMLDIDGFVSETNATNIFFVKAGKIKTPFADSCLPGITRANVITIAHEDHLPISEKRISMTEMYTADEVFVTGSMGEITPVLAIDGRTVGAGVPGKITGRVMEKYQELTRNHGVAIPKK